MDGKLIIAVIAITSALVILYCRRVCGETGADFEKVVCNCLLDRSVL